jgi:hypothetical protein
LEGCVDVDQSGPLRTSAWCSEMSTMTEKELQEWIADYRRLRIGTRDKQVLEAIDRIIAESRARLHQLETQHPAIATFAQSSS